MTFGISVLKTPGGFQLSIEGWNTAFKWHLQPKTLASYSALKNWPSTLHPSSYTFLILLFLPSNRTWLATFVLLPPISLCHNAVTHSLRKSNPTIYKDVVLAASVWRILHKVGFLINAGIEEMVVLREQKALPQAKSITCLRGQSE